MATAICLLIMTKRTRCDLLISRTTVILYCFATEVEQLITVKVNWSSV